MCTFRYNIHNDLSIFFLKDKELKEKEATYALPDFLKLTHHEYIKLD